MYVMDVGSQQGEEVLEPGDEILEINKRRIVQAAMSDVLSLLERVPVSNLRWN